MSQQSRQLRSAEQTAKHLAIAEKRRRACELHVAGWSLDAIAVELGYATRSGAWRAIQRTIKEIPAKAGAEAKAIALERARWGLERARKVVEASPDDTKAIASYLAACDHVAKLEGTYAPTKVQEVPAEKLGLADLIRETEIELLRAKGQAN